MVHRNIEENVLDEVRVDENFEFNLPFEATHSNIFVTIFLERKTPATLT